ncbi:MAG: hypothetical protein JNK05_23175 [Myxococcales bacterium]|nr:hypothetical protein [Myxococcales bacterium]
MRAEGRAPTRYGPRVQSEMEVDAVDSSESDERVCCPDDLCTGALDSSGLCGTCGRLFSQYARSARDDANEARAEANEGDRERGSSPADAMPEAAELRSMETENADEADERVCCPNDTCTGALDREGVCGTCGQKATSASEG